MRIVCDTNILVSALLFPGGAPDEVFALARLGEVELYLSPDIISEFKQVLVNKFKYAAKEADVFVGRILAASTLVYPSERLHVIERVPADNRILECAVTAKAEYLVTGDKRDILPLKTIGECKIISAREFLQTLATEGP